MTESSKPRGEMKIVFAMLAMLVSGLSLGAGGMTLYWSGQMTRGFRAQAEWKQISERLEAIAKKNQDGWNECLAFVQPRL